MPLETTVRAFRIACEVIATHSGLDAVSRRWPTAVQPLVANARHGIAAGGTRRHIRSTRCRTSVASILGAMTDLLVRLYDLPARRAVEGIDVRRALPPEKHAVSTWVRETFGLHWASECDVAFAHQPVGCHVALREGAVLGVACWDATARGFFGPIGTIESERGKGIGAALLLDCLHAMAAHGYGYAVIGGVGPTAFYERVVPTTEIPDSSPGIYGGLLR